MTEDDAKNKRCPAYNYPNHKNCIASQCMAWRRLTQYWFKSNNEPTQLLENVPSELVEGDQFTEIFNTATADWQVSHD